MYLIFLSKFMDLFMFISDILIPLCVFVSLSCAVCVCQWVFVHGCHIIYMDEWPSQARVTLSKTLGAVTVHSTSAPLLPLSDWQEYHVSSQWSFKKSRQLYVTRWSLTNSHDSEVQQWVGGINRLLCDVLNILQGAMKINKGQYRTGRHYPGDRGNSTDISLKETCHFVENSEASILQFYTDSFNTFCFYTGLNSTKLGVSLCFQSLC